MRTRATPARPDPAGRRTSAGVPSVPPTVGREWIVSSATMGAAAAVVLLFFLSLWPLHHLRVPVGWDSVDYVWRTRVAQRTGIAHIASAVPPGMFVKGARPAFPAVAATLSSLGGMSVLLLAVAFPAVMASAVGLAAGALVRVAGRFPRWSAPLTAIVVGTSVNAVLMAQYGYEDNLMIAAVFVAAAVPIVLAVDDRPALLPAIALLGAAGLVHGALFILALAVVGVTAVAFLPASWRGWRQGASVPDTPSGRLVQALAGGGVVAALALFATVAGRPEPRLNRGEVSKKLREDLPRYGYWWLAPGAALGAVGLGVQARGGRDDRSGASRTRTLLTFLGGWTVVTFGGYGLYRLTRLPIPANRFLLFGFALPTLMAVGMVWLAGLVRGPRILSAAVAAAMALAALAFSYGVWIHRPAPGVGSWIDAEKLHDAKVVVAYLDASGIPPSRPVVMVVDDRGPFPGASVSLMRDHLFAVFPVDRLAHTFVFMGDPQDFLAGRPSRLEGNPSYTAQSAAYFRLVRPVLGDDPVALISPSFNQSHHAEWVGAHPGSIIPGTEVAVVSGPQPPAPFPRVPLALREPSLVQLGLLGAFGLGSLALIGLGWSMAMLRRWLGPGELLAVSPAVGVAVLTLGASLADRMGLRLAGVAGALVPVALAILGWLMMLLSRRSGARAPGPSPR